jgi:hypothetical protein
VTRIDYADSSYKELTRTGGLVTQIDWVRLDGTTRKTLTYSAGTLAGVTETEL